MASADSDSILQTLPQNKQLKTFTRADVAQHKKEGDVWFIIDSVGACPCAPPVEFGRRC